MRNHKSLFLLFLLAGCSPAKEVVFVDLDKVPMIPTKPTVTVVPKANAAKTAAPGSRTIPGQSGAEIESLRADEKKTIRDEVERETKAAIATITDRLQDYYKREVDEFYRTESDKLTPYKTALNDEYLQEIRIIFEASAKKRGPALIRLSFLTEFPPPEKPVPLEGEDLTKSEKAKRVEIRSLQDQIAEIDKEYKLDVEKLDAKYKDRFDKRVETFLEQLKQKQKEIDLRASNEAARLVRRFSSGLSERIFSRYTFQLKEIPTKTVNFPKIADQPGIPRVPFDRAHLDKDDKAGLAKELETFLSLKRYERSPVSSGARDVTTEFIEWRTNLKSGHWESWQKSSTPK